MGILMSSQPPAPVVKVPLPDGKKLKIKVDVGPPFRSSGNFSDLFKGTAPDQRRVALKRCRLPIQGVSPEERELIESESEIRRLLQSEYVVPFIGQGYDKNGFIYLVSPWMDNGSVWDYIHGNPRSPRLKLLHDTAKALAFVHSKSYIHGDIRAENILVSQGERALLCDFRLTRANDTATVAGLKGFGSLPFQSPEVWLGVSRTAKSDVYAFGMTIYQVISRSYPFTQYLACDTAILKAVVNKNERPPRKPPATPANEDCRAFWDVAERCWQREVVSRPAMQRVADMLAAPHP